MLPSTNSQPMCVNNKKDLGFKHGKNNKTMEIAWLEKFVKILVLKKKN